MKPIQKLSLVDTAVTQLREQITEGNWPVGTRIPSEADLTQTLAVSRPSVREAVRSLVQLGLLEARQGDGTYVVANDPTEVALRRAIDDADSREVIRVRQALDVLAAQEAAHHRTAADLRELEAHLDARRAAVAAADVDAFAQHDVAFHLGVARASGNRLLMGLYGSFDDSLRASVSDATCLSQGMDPDRNGTHEALLEAIAAGRADEAAAAARAVLDHQEQLLDEQG